MISAQRRVVLTGMGLISPVGNTKEDLWDALSAGRSGVRPLDAQQFGSAPVAVAASAQQFTGDIEDFGPMEKEVKKALRKGLKLMCRESQMGVAAAQRALHDAGLCPGKYDPDRTGVAFGSDYMVTEPDDFLEGIRECLDAQRHFEFSRWAAQGLPKMSPLWLLNYLPNMPASHIAIYNDLRGPSNSITLREAGANLSVAEACQTILAGRADTMVCGATGTRLHPMKVIHAVQQEEVAHGNGDPARVSRPFDLNRQGMVLGEGAGAVVLEELRTAQARGATIYAEVIGGASSSVAQRSRLTRRGEALRNVMAGLLKRYQLAPDDVGHLHAHGLSTHSGDAEEAWAIDQLFAGRSQPLPVVAAKSCFGNLGAGSGVVELIASVLAVQQGRLFRVQNYETPDPNCPVSPVREDGLPPGKCFISVNVTPQAQASGVLARQFEE